MLVRPRNNSISDALIPVFVPWRDYATVDSKSIRLKNLKILVAEAGGQKELADRVATDAAYLSQLKTRNRGRGLGDKLARRLEIAMQKPIGWMDHDNTPPDPSKVTSMRQPFSEDTLQAAKLIEALTPPQRKQVLGFLALLSPDAQPSQPARRHRR